MMTKQRRARGVAAIWVILLVLLTISLWTWAALAYIKYSDRKDQQFELQLKRDALKKELEEYRRKVAALPEATGFAGQTVSDQPVWEYVKAKKYKAESAYERHFPLGAGDKAVQEAGITDFAGKVNVTTLYDSVEELVIQAYYKAQNARFRHDHEKWYRDMVSRRPDMIDQMMKPGFSDKRPELKGRILEEIKNVSQMIQRDQNEYQQRKAELEAKIERIREARRADEARREHEKEQYEKEKRKLRNIFEELVKSKEHVPFVVTKQHVHGTLVSPDIEQKYAWIDIGSKDRVVPGLWFLIARPGKQNAFEYKGAVEVRHVYLTDARVEIRAVYDQDRPLTHGDLLVNPFFHRNRPLRIAFAGAEKPPGHRFSRTDARRRLIEFGNVIDEKPGIWTDVLLWTDFEVVPSEEEEEKAAPGEYPTEWWDAAILGIPIGEAKELYRFLGE